MKFFSKKNSLEKGRMQIDQGFVSFFLNLMIFQKYAMPEKSSNVAKICLLEAFLMSFQALKGIWKNCQNCGKMKQTPLINLHYTHF